MVIKFGNYTVDSSSQKNIRIIEDDKAGYFCFDIKPEVLDRLIISLLAISKFHSKNTITLN
jgi:hypothetical protein